jgi:Outer membrane protein beta-barrel domain
MSVRGVTLYFKRVTSYALPAVCALGVSVFCATGATAQESQAQDSHSFSSSTDGAAASSSTSSSADPLSAPLPASPAAAGQSDNSYGSHHHSIASKLTFEAGGGVNAPTSDSSSYVTWGGNFTVGGGYRFNSHLSGLIEYQFIDDKLPGVLIGEAGATGGDAHIWSFTLAPVVDIFPKRTNDVYVTGGGGFYRKVTNFTDPEEVEFCSEFFCSVGDQNTVVGHLSSNQGGWNVGAGFTHRMGGIYGDGHVKLFAEARYLDILTPAVTSSPNGLGTTTIAADTKLVPVTLGVRF